MQDAMDVLLNGPGMPRRNFADFRRDTEFFWADPVMVNVDGTAMFEPDEQALLDRLFERFGLKLRVRGSQLDAIGEGYDLCVLWLSRSIGAVKTDGPGGFERSKSIHWEGWSEDWQAYGIAVLEGDVSEAKKLASKLKLGTRECEFPPFVRELVARIEAQKKREAQASIASSRT